MHHPTAPLQLLTSQCKYISFDGNHARVYNFKNQPTKYLKHLTAKITSQANK